MIISRPILLMQLLVAIALASLSGITAADTSSINNSGPVYLATNGNVSIGTTNASAKLLVTGGNLLQTISSSPKITGYISNAVVNQSTCIKIIGRYAYVESATSEDFYSVDIHNPYAPRPLGSINSLSGTNCVSSTGKYSYVVGEGTPASGTAIGVMDVSDPGKPLFIGEVDVAEYPYVTGGDILEISGNYAYHGSGTRNVSIFDISNPYFMKLVGVLTNETVADINSIYISGKYAYIGSSVAETITVADISNPYAPTVVGNLTDATNLDNLITVRRYGNHLYAAGLSRNYLTLINATNASNITVIKRLLDGRLADGINMHPAGRYVYYLADAADSFAAIDVSDPTAPNITGYLTDSTRLDDVYDLYFSGKYAQVVSRNSDAFTTIDIGGADLPLASIGSIETSSANVFDNAYVNNDLYSANGIVGGDSGIYSQGLSASDIRQYVSTAPVLVGNLTASTLDGVIKFAVQGKYAYGGGFLTGTTFNVIDVSNVLTPRVLGSVSDARFGGMSDVFAAGKYTYVTSYNNDSLIVVDVSNPASPTVTGSLSHRSMDGATSLHVSGKYAYVTAANNASLSIIDVSRPDNPVLAGRINNTNLRATFGIYVSGKYAYVTAANTSTLTIINISNPYQPTITGTVTDSTNLAIPFGIYVSGRYAYSLASTNDRVTIVDVSSPSAPAVSGTVSSATYLGEARDIMVAGRYAYVPAYTNGRIAILDVLNATSPTIMSGIRLSNDEGSTIPTSIYVSGLYAYVAHPDDRLYIFRLPGTEAPAASTGSLKANSLNVLDNVYVNNDVNVRGGVTAGNIYSTANMTVPYLSINVANSSSSSNYRLNVNGQVNATAYIANGSDYAEILPKLDENEAIEPGDVVAVVGGKVTRPQNLNGQRPALYMVVTGSAGVIGNGDRDGVPVAFVGRVRVKVGGYVNEGDYVLADSTHTGYARTENEITFDEYKENMIGVALESGSGSVMVAVGVK